MRVLLILLFTLISLSLGQAKDFPLPEGTKFVFPKGGSIRAEWVVPSNSSYLKERKRVNFDIDGKGEPWLGIEGKYLYNPIKRIIFQVETPFRDFLFLSDSEFIVATRDALGVLTYSDKASGLTFLPVVALPPGEVKLVKGGEKSLFVLIQNLEKGFSQVYQLIDKGGKGEVVKIFETKERVKDLCVANESLYLAIDKMLIKISLPSKKMTLFFRHIDSLKEIECLGEDQIFYTTSKRIGLAGKVNTIEFAQVFNPQIRLKNQTLYILHEETLGLIKIDNINRLR